jgi:hypothetical protein
MLPCFRISFIRNSPVIVFHDKNLKEVYLCSALPLRLAALQGLTIINPQGLIQCGTVSRGETPHPMMQTRAWQNWDYASIEPRRRGFPKACN